MGTRFIATQECQANPEYISAILKAQESDIVLTWRVTGVPLSVINTPFVQKMGTQASWFAKWLLSGRVTKHWVRLGYSVLSLFRLKKAMKKGFSSKDYFQAGKSVSGIEKIESVSELIQRLNKT